MSDKEPARVIILIRESEIRIPQIDEIFFNICGDLDKCDMVSAGKRFCYTQHPIDIKDDSHTLTIQTRGSGQTPPAVHINLPPVRDPLVEKIKKVVLTTRWTADSLAREIAALVREGGVK
jgi:hypothetical protein